MMSGIFIDNKYQPLICLVTLLPFRTVKGPILCPSACQ